MPADADPAVQRGRDNVVAGASFEERVADVYRLLNYRVEHGRLFSGRQVDLFLDGQFGDLKLQRAIECKAGVVNADDIDSFIAKLALVRREYPAAQGTLVTATSFTDAVIAHANAAGVAPITFRDLEAKLFDSFSYATRLEMTLKGGDGYDSKLYVEPHIADASQTEDTDAFRFVDDWLLDGAWNQLTLLGDVGTGKSFFSRMFALRQIERFRKAPLEARLPVLVDLRNTDRLFSLEGLILTHFANAGLPHVSFAVFKHVLASGRIVLLLDGFDEMAARVSRNVTARNFQELTKAISGRAKVILTCRTHYFRSRTEEEEIVLGRASDYSSEAARDLYWDLISRKGFRIAYLRPFSWAQVEQYVELATPRTAKQTLTKIRKTYNLAELSQRPMLLEMIVKSLDRLASGSVNVSTLYRVFTDAWINRDAWREVLSPEHKLQFVTTLAKALWKSGQDRLHYSELSSHVKTELAQHIDTPQHFFEIDNEVRTATFLTRDDEGHYGFAHKSYLEFFVARHLAQELNRADVRCLSGRKVTPEVIEFMRWLVEPNVEKLLEETITAEFRPGISENALISLYQMRRAHAFANVKAGTTEVMILAISMPTGVCMNGAQLDGVVLEGAELREAQFQGAALQDTVFSLTDLTHANLAAANLEKAQFSSATLVGANLQDARCMATQFGGADMRECVASRADFREAFLQSIVWDEAEFEGCQVAGATMDPDLESEFVHMGLLGEAGRGAVDSPFWAALTPMLPRIRRSAFIRAYPAGVDAEDLVSQLVVVLANPKTQKRFIDADPSTRWGLVRSALGRLSEEEHRRARRSNASIVSTESDDGERLTTDLEELLLSNASNASGSATSGYERVLIEEMKEQLSPEAWALFYGRYFEGYTVAELAQTQPRSESDVAKQLAKCIEILAAWFHRPGAKN